MVPREAIYLEKEQNLQIRGKIVKYFPKTLEVFSSNNISKNSKQMQLIPLKTEMIVESINLYNLKSIQLAKILWKEFQASNISVWFPLNHPIILIKCQPSPTEVMKRGKEIWEALRIGVREQI